MKNTTVALVAVVAVTAILLASMLTEDALAKKCRSKGGEGTSSASTGLYKPKRSMHKHWIATSGS